MSRRDKETVTRDKEKIWSVRNQFPDMSIKDIAIRVDLPYSTVYATIRKIERQERTREKYNAANN